jgi:hypothetical protein
MKNEDNWPAGLEKCHLLWALHKLKAYNKESTMAKSVSVEDPVDEKTFRKWTKIVVARLQKLKYIVVSL